MFWSYLNGGIKEVLKSVCFQRQCIVVVVDVVFNRFNLCDWKMLNINALILCSILFTKPISFICFIALFNANVTSLIFRKEKFRIGDHYIWKGRKKLYMIHVHPCWCRKNKFITQHVLFVSNSFPYYSKYS